ncbi:MULTISPECIES: HsmA family protein [Acetobacterium]|uniref:TIGR03987 family protein n=1 Tax=Acetobacterium wieringae TaxID=52694 RepID=A0A5D0WL80_9FIRM|nr:MULTISPECIES: HsmA family protein [Acetobacterium]MEA4806211.1 HsmA family protein [Acetobacterium wieringae]OXS26545.1 MAG: TIGR03987 family protein [Acetobacterium sp. MES1]TYC84866.1 TIGR03987 family protein [Acetobacterium wieringae]URN82776.1 TIGR03987 family protein [Acetobacterium wieringae]
MLVYASTAITMALVFYSIGVWSEKLQGQLKVWHLVVFYLGLVCDTIGTMLMGELAGGVTLLSFHGITGLLAILLMLFHAVWATVVLVRNDQKARANFHKLSLIVWLIWLIPFVSGAIFGVAF